MSLVHLCCQPATTSTCTFRDFKPLQSAGLPEFQLYLIFGRGWSALFFMKFRWNGQTKSYTADKACGYRISSVTSHLAMLVASKKTVCMYYVSFNKCLVISRLIKALFSSRKKIYTSITSKFGHMHDVLNVDKKFGFHRLSVNCEMNLMSLISPWLDNKLLQ